MDNISDSHISLEDQSDLHQLLRLPDLVGDVNSAKAYLLQTSSETGENLYDHLTDVLNKLLTERPQNVVDFFEEYSRKVKEERYRFKAGIFQDIFIEPLRYDFTKKIMPFLKPEKSVLEPSTENENEPDLTKSDLMQCLHYCEKSGIILPKTEFYYLELSMKKLAKDEKLADIRFWGIIYGIKKNYYIVEATLSEEVLEQINRPVEIEDEIQIPEEVNKKESVKEIDMDAGEGVNENAKISKIPRPLPPLPLPQYTRPSPVPKEPTGEGANSKVYYVCNEPGDPWIQLPDVTPEEIVVARQIIKSFTGELDSEIVTYPKFSGTERNYLRAQIARISAGTQISPLGYFTFKSGEEHGEDEEEEEVGEEGVVEEKTTYKVNKFYEPHALRDLTDMSMSFWVHHTLYILPQGRTKWWNPKPKSEEKGFGEMDEEESIGEDRPEPETGPPLLTSLSEDASLETIPPWTVQASSSLLPERAVAVVRSNLWPGAFTFSSGKYFENIYVGYGQKHFASNFSPSPLPCIQEEYPIGPEVTEMTDPTAAMEEEWRIAHEKKPPSERMLGEEMNLGEGEGEEEEDEDDDD